MYRPEHPVVKAKVNWMLPAGGDSQDSPFALGGIGYFEVWSHKLTGVTLAAENRAWLYGGWYGQTAEHCDPNFVVQTEK